VHLPKRAWRLGLFFIGILLAGGVLLMYKGNDAVAQGIAKKDGILTAEQVKVSFQSVSGKMVNEAVQESQEVKAGDILMQLDSTDVDLDIAKTQAQIAQLDAQIQSMEGTIAIGFAQTDTSQEESRRQIDQQRAAIDSATATLVNAQRDYDRKSSLYNQGAIAKADFDDSQAALSVAQANMNQQQQALSKLLGGAVDTGDSDSLQLPQIEEQRQTIANKRHDRESLVQQRNQLQVQLQQLEVQKDRLTLRAPEDGKVLKLLAKQGEIVQADTPVILLESKRQYYDIYVSEKQAVHLHEGQALAGVAVSDGQPVAGTIRFITQAPGFADLKETREKGQADLTAFQIRIYTDPGQDVRPGQTIEVTDHELPET
uniref:HlyD family secretion protein n=1 Tax=uncultured Megasphaera sp. TaxID=165188 RepID=UPI0034434717